MSERDMNPQDFITEHVDVRLHRSRPDNPRPPDHACHATWKKDDAREQ